MDSRGQPPYRTAGLVLVLLCVTVLAQVYFQFRGVFTPGAQLTLLADRAGLVMEPGCWQSVTRELWPAPYLVMDTGASIAPYYHFELGRPLLIEHVWGRQVGEYSINP